MMKLFGMAVDLLVSSSVPVDLVQSTSARKLLHMARTIYCNHGAL